LAVSPTDCYRRNMAALLAYQPDVAAVVDEALIPDGVTTATGRDGTETFLIPSNAGEPMWFGGSSMPSISGAEIFAGFYGEGCNVSLPGVLTGVELLVVASRMPPYTALFVIEEDPLQLKLAMHLRDYADLLRAGRLVFLLGSGGGLVESFCTFFEHHPGYELPTHLLTAPQRSASQIADVQGKLEAAGKTVTAVQGRLVESLVQAIHARPSVSLSRSPRVAVLGIDPNPVSLEQARRIEHSLMKLQWPYKLCIPDAPDKCHVSARLSAINEAAADLVLFVNGTPGSMRSLLPNDLPITSWLGPGTIVQPLPGGEPGECEVILVSSRGLYDELTNLGVPDNVIERCDVSADDTIHQPATHASDEPITTHADVAVLMDLPNDRAKACNITLASHVALWKALKVVVKHSVDRYHGDMADELLDAAQRDSGTSLQDHKVRQHFMDLVQTRIAPATIARANAETLIAKGYRVAVWGCNWTPLGDAGVDRHDAIPVGDALNRIFKAVRIVLLPASTPLVIQTALDALAAGAQVICRRPDQSFERDYPGLANLAPHLPLYQTSRELLDLVSALASSTDEASDPCETARALVRIEHTVARRLQSIVETIRRRQALDAQADYYSLTPEMMD